MLANRGFAALVALVSVGAGGTVLAQTSEVAVEPDSAELQYDLYYFTTGRWQVDNGTRTGPEDGFAWDPTGEDFGEWNNTFGGSVRYGSFQLAAQIDAATYVHRPRAADNATAGVRTDLESRYEDVLRLEIFSLSYSGRTFDVTIGDFYVTLGRGMLLAIRKIDDLSIDNKLRGGEARVRVGPVTVYGFAGFLNIRNYEAGQAFFYPESLPEADCSATLDALALCKDGTDLIVGGRLEYRAGKYIKAGVHAATIDAPDVLGEADFRGVGATVELPRPVRWLNAYAEGVLLERDLGPDTTETGRGFYGNMNLFLGKATVLLEGKAYDNLFNVIPRGVLGTLTASRQSINRIVEPPTAERPFTRILANNTTAGGHVRLDYRVTPRLVPFAAGGYFRDQSFEVPTNIVFGYGGFRYRWSGGTASVDAGYRAQLNDTDTVGAQNAVDGAQRVLDEADGPDETLAAQQALDRAQVLLRQADLRDGTAFRNDAHLRFDVSVDLVGPYSLELFADTFFVISEQGLADCREETAAQEPACQSRSPDDNPLVLLPPEEWLEGRIAVSVRSKSGWSLTGAYEFYTRQPEFFAQHYPSLAGQWDFTDGGTVRFLVGGERAGLKCSGGVCRFFPGFEGGRLELSLRL